MASNGGSLTSPMPSEVAKACGKLGGIRSGESKRAKKTMREVYSNFIEAMTQEQFDGFIKRVLENADSSTVSMFREMREGTDGSKIKIDNTGSVEEDKSLLEKLLATE